MEQRHATPGLPNPPQGATPRGWLDPPQHGGHRLIGSAAGCPHRLQVPDHHPPRLISQGPGGEQGHKQLTIHSIHHRKSDGDGPGEGEANGQGAH